MPLSANCRNRLQAKLQTLYGDAAQACLKQIVTLVERYDFSTSSRFGPLWSERDVVLITYGDQVRSPDRTPLETLDCFLQRHRLDSALNMVHLLPFFPYSSDDGFSVINYRQVDPKLGDWNDVSALGRSYGLMFDLVLNHCSTRHEWFEQFLSGIEPYTGYFQTVDPSTDLSQVTRPRSSPLLTPFETSRGTEHVWTTFSDDQVDLNFANPAVLVAMLAVLLDYVSRGARIIRLDAIAYLWKRIGSHCIHLPETHLVVKLMRDLLDDLAPGTILLTETNVPHAENVSYFGDGDEAQMVYQFSLAPLLLDAFLNGDAGVLNNWLRNLEPCRSGTTFFNFTASHDGVGVRPLEGLVSPERLDRLVESIQQRGGRVSTKRNPDGSDSPYELNIAYFSALADVDSAKRANTAQDDLHVRRFLASQAIMAALRGIPGVYFHSLVGTSNFVEGVERTGQARTINRRKFELDELEQILADSTHAQRRVFDGYRRLLATRIRQPAFHPDAGQAVVDVDESALIGFVRTALDGVQQILVLANVSNRPVAVRLSRLVSFVPVTNLLTGHAVSGDTFTLAPYEVAWLTSVDATESYGPQ